MASLLRYLPEVNHLRRFRGTHGPAFSGFGVAGPVRSSEGASGVVLVCGGAADATDLASVAAPFAGGAVPSDAGAGGLAAFRGAGFFGGG